MDGFRSGCSIPTGTTTPHPPPQSTSSRAHPWCRACPLTREPPARKPKPLVYPPYGDSYYSFSPLCSFPLAKGDLGRLPVPGHRATMSSRGAVAPGLDPGLRKASGQRTVSHGA
jgi:hypothetical protein